MKIPRLIIETGEKLEEDQESGVSRGHSGKNKKNHSEVEKRKGELGIETSPIEKRKERYADGDLGLGNNSWNKKRRVAEDGGPIQGPVSQMKTGARLRKV